MAGNLSIPVRQVVLARMGGLYTEADQRDLPMGASPLCSDNDFIIGSTTIRPGLVSVEQFGITTPPTAPGPSITSLTPSSGPTGTSVTINGSGFGATQGSSQLAFGSSLVTPTSWSDTAIVFTVPAGAPTGQAVVTVSVNFVATTATFNVTGTTPPGTTIALASISGNVLVPPPSAYAGQAGVSLSLVTPWYPSIILAIGNTINVTGTSGHYDGAFIVGNISPQPDPYGITLVAGSASSQTTILLEQGSVIFPAAARARPAQEEVPLVPVRVAPRASGDAGTIAPGATIYYLRGTLFTWVNSVGPVVLIEASDGTFWVDYGVSGFSSQVYSGILNNARMLSETFGQYEYCGLGNWGNIPQNMPLQGVDQPRTFTFDSVSGPEIDRVSQGPPASNNWGVTPSGSATATTATPLPLANGQRWAVLLYQMRNGYITSASVPVTFSTTPPGGTGNTGYTTLTFNNLPTGPPEAQYVIAAVTIPVPAVQGVINPPNAGIGGPYFWVPLESPVTNSVGTHGTVVPNGTASFSITLSDVILTTGVNISVPGNNLISGHQRELGEFVKVVNYGGRAFYLGERTKVDNLINMTFDGGITTNPSAFEYIPGWNQVGAHLSWSLVQSEIYGLKLVIQNLQASLINPESNLTDWLEQPVTYDAFGVPILQPHTQYNARITAWADPVAAGVASVSLNVGPNSNAPGTPPLTTTPTEYTLVNLNGGGALPALATTTLAAPAPRANPALVTIAGSAANPIGVVSLNRFAVGISVSLYPAPAKVVVAWPLNRPGTPPTIKAGDKCQVTGCTKYPAFNGVYTVNFVQSTSIWLTPVPPGLPSNAVEGTTTGNGNVRVFFEDADVSTLAFFDAPANSTQIIANTSNSHFDGSWVVRTGGNGTLFTVHIPGSYDPVNYRQSGGGTFGAAPGTGGGGGIGPSISSLNPASGAVGTTVTVSGSGFGATQGASSISLLSPNTWSDTSITAVVPFGATTGNVTVIVGGVASNSILFTVTGAGLPAKLLVVPLNMPASSGIFIDRIELYPATQPVYSTQLIGSYIVNYQAVDAQTGVLDTSEYTYEAQTNAYRFLQSLYIETDNHTFSTSTDAMQEPSGWSIQEVSNAAGCVGPAGADVGEEYVVKACRRGVYIFDGGNHVLISREIQSLWEMIYWPSGTQIWVKNDLHRSRLYVGVPMITPNQWLPDAPHMSTPALPNVVLMCNYLGDATGAEIAGSPGVHVSSFSGQLLARDFVRKWSPWLIPSAYGTVILRGAKSGNLAGYEQVWLGGENNATVWNLDPAARSDNGNQVIPQVYCTYGFADEMNADAKQLLTTRRIYSYMSVTTEGEGNLVLTTFPTALDTPYADVQPPVKMMPIQVDRNIPINETGDRLFLKFAPDGNLGSYFTLHRVVLGIQPDPWIPVTGSDEGEVIFGKYGGSQ